MNNKTHKCSMGRIELIITSITLIVIIGIIIFQFFSLPDSVIFFIIPFILLFIVLLIWTLVPQKVIITDKEIIIKRLFKDFKIDINTILGVKVHHKMYFMKNIRIIGLTGLFGYYGYFCSLKYGKYYSISNNSESAIYIMTSKGSYVISCNDSADAVTEIYDKIK